ncbi:MAG: VWA domain-containing protein [Planctomycetota bacterium]
MSEWELRNPIFLWVAVIAPLVFLLAGRSPATVTYSSLELLKRAPRGLRARLARLPALLLALATCALAVALAGPRTGDATTRIHREGLAILAVVDRSGSMMARDFARGDESRDRLEVVKSVLGDFVRGGKAGEGRVDDLVGLVAFGTYADGLCPLTLDHGNLIHILEEVEVAVTRGEGQTAIGEGLALAVERLRRHPARSKVAILLTDGVSNAGDITPRKAAELAAAHDIKVYTIGAGTTGVAPMPVIDPRTGKIAMRRGKPVLEPARVELDEETLKAIAAKTGGRYFHATDAEGLAAAYREIDRLERSEITEVRYRQYEERYGLPVAIALACIGLAGLAGGTVLRRLP